MSFLRLYGRVLAALGPERRLGWLLALLNTALALALFAEPILFGRIVDTLVRAQAADRTPGWGELIPQLGAWAGFGLFTILAGVLISLHADRLAHRRRLGIMSLYFEHVLQLPLGFHSEVHSGRLLKIMLQGADGLWGLWLAFFREHCAGMVALVVLLPVAVWVNWRLGLLLVVLLAIFAGFTFYVLNRTQHLQQNVERLQSDLAERSADALGNVAVIQSFTRIEAEVRGLRRTMEEVLAVQIPVLSWWAMVSIATRAATTLTILAIFLVGTALHLSGVASIGEIVTFVGFATMLVGRLDQLVAFCNTLVMDAPRLSEFFTVLDTVANVRDRPDAVPLGPVTGAVAFEDVSFSYDGKRTALADVSFRAAPGETIALVGPTGAGKSTALALLHRAFDPQSGRITIDGHDIRAVTLASLRRAIGVVFQEAMLFNRSIEENLRVGRPEATAEEVRVALERAQAAEFVARQSEGLATIVGERGRSLSGGERQRLAIARALLKDPPILILDEATSALDAGTEAKVQEALDEVMKGRTTFVIAHRLATIRNADRILLFEGGRIVEAGTFDELVRLGGRFAALARAQFMVGGPASGEAPPVET
ncbi:glucan ABC transporter ATP-binding protein/ permease [Ancylobacter sp. 6x-1]|uniref:Glucan ABC transporter ATP-binding protein/ permease n=1 Tax=Ancylobacter crimeensis TaxID=2579147 RepID=A0ABT0DDL7_9HYPH|nr:glucan ABC transporter ATP-binding protein/ permease [Ancylobacter crimeensis]MCK0198050.1 glucan ABC transporter ATP-binding protein/ permease [Ancylobacter crimeensis]